MRRIFEAAAFVVGAALITAGAAPGQALAPDVSRPEVRTVATAVRNVPPTLAVLHLNIKADGRTPREAGRRLALLADTLRRSLMRLGVPHDSILTGSDWYWSPGRIEVVVTNGRLVQLSKVDSAGRMSYYFQDTTYRAHDALEVRIREMGKIGAIIDSALAHAVSEISPVRFEASDLSGPRNLALRSATEDARGQAESIAASSGMRLGRVLSFSTYSEANRYPFPDVGLEAAMATGGAGGGTEVIPRLLPVSVTVYGRWELIPRQ